MIDETCQQHFNVDSVYDDHMSCISNLNMQINKDTQLSDKCSAEQGTVL